MTAAPSGFAGGTAPAADCHWLMSAAEMAAEVSGVWPLARHPAAQGRPGYPKVATRTPGAGAESVRVARDFTGATLQRWGADERSDDIVVVVSELLTNALFEKLEGLKEEPIEIAVHNFPSRWGAERTEQLEKAVEDVWAGLHAWRLWTLFGLNDVKMRYRRSTLGPFWATLSMGIIRPESERR